MFKKTLISLAVASSVALTGCLGGNGTGKNAGVENTVTSNQYSGRSYPEFNPITSQVPVPDDLLYSGTTDGTFTVSGSDPVHSALNQLTGASTNAPIDIPISGTVDASTIDANSVIETKPGDLTSLAPNPNQNVFLIKLKYASGDPLQALNNSEPPTIPYATCLGGLTSTCPSDTPSVAQTLLSRYQNEPYTAKVLNLNGQTVLRIVPLKPLDANTRYEVVLTNGIKDNNGDPLIGSPSFQDYSTNTNYQPNSSVDAVRNLINKLWDPVAVNYFATLNPSRTAAGLPDLTKSNIVLSYSLTTTNDQQVLQDIEDPTTWAYNLINTQIADTTVKTVLASAPTTSESTLETDVAAAKAAYTNSNCGSATGDAAIKCAAQAVVAGVSLAGQSFPTPQSVSSMVTFSPVVPTIQSGSTTLQFPNEAQFISAYVGKIYQDIFSSATTALPTNVNVVQGTMTVPYYMGQPSGTDGTAITSDTWKPNDALATALNGILGLSSTTGFPQASGASSNVNYLFPFPQKRSDQTIPVLAMYPKGALSSGSANNLTTVIFQHGITTDRSSALTIGSAMIQAYEKATGGTKHLAVIAIDQPLHGVVLTNSTDEANTAASLLGYTSPLTSTQQATVNAVVGGTYHDAVIQSVQSSCSALSSVSGEQNLVNTVLSGSCGATAAANMVGALELENSAQHPGSIVPGLAHTAHERTFDFTQNPTTGLAIPQVASQGKQLNRSGSLFINLANFINGRDNLREAVLDLLTLRKSIGKMDLNGDGYPDLNASDVYFVGHSLGAIDGGVFAAIANSKDINGNYNTATELQGVDLLAPGGGIVRLLDNSPSFANAILTGLAGAGLSTGDVNLETFFNVDQAAVDAGDPINFVNDWKNNQKPMLLTEFIGDQTIPNLPYGVKDPSTLGCYLSGQTSSSLCGYSLDGIAERGAPLSGTEALLTNSGASNIDSTNSLTATFSSSAPVWDVRLTKGTHGTPVMYTDTNQALAFGEIVNEITSMIATGGANVTATSSSTAVKSQY